MYGLGNWAEVAEHVGTKCKEKCINHYSNVYMRSLFFPLPDMLMFLHQAEQVEDFTPRKYPLKSLLAATTYLRLLMN